MFEFGLSEKQLEKIRQRFYELVNHKLGDSIK